MPFCRILLIICATITSFSTVIAQQLYVDKPDATNFPTVEAEFYAFDAAGTPIRTLTPASFTVQEDGIQRTVTSVTCPTVSAEPISAVLMLDVSSSMSEPAGATRIDVVKSAATAFIDALSDGISECAVGSFDDYGYINQDFTTDKTALKSAISRLRPLLGTDYDQALLTPPAGALEIARTAKYKKVIIFLTDGLGAGNEQAILAKAKTIGATIYCITAGMPMPPVLQHISEQTNGSWYENITSQSEAIAIFQSILHRASGSSPCKIRWISGVSCADSLRMCKISVPALAVSTVTSYTPPVSALARLLIAPQSLSFGAIPPAGTASLPCTITAQGAAITIRNITSSLPVFSVSPAPTYPFTLAAGESKQISVRFSPVDSFFRTAVLTIETDICPAELYVSGGFPGKFPIPPDLVLKRPNGGEQFIVGSKELLEWKGIPPTDTVTLEYSTDGGQRWNFIANAAGLQYTWSVPNTPSNNCLARVTQTIAKSGGATKILTLNKHTNTVQAVAFSPDGSRAATASSDGTAIIWDAKTGAELTRFTGHTGIVNSLAFFSDGTRCITGSADNTARVWNTADGTQTQLLAGHTAPVLSAELSPNGATAVTACDDGTLRVWNVPLESTTRVLSGHSTRVYSCAFSPDGQTILSASGDRTARLWNATSGKETPPPFTLHGNSVRCGEFSPDGRRAATGGSDNTVYIWDTASRLPQQTLQGNVLSVRSVAWSGQRLLTGGEDGRVIIWDVNTGAQILALPPYADAITSVGWNNNGETIIVATGNVADIWTIRAVASQQDTSDAHWSIVKPQVSTRNVVFPQVVVGSAQDSVITALLGNSGTFPAEIAGMSIIGINTSDFELISGAPPFTLNGGASHAVEIRFRPGAAGVRTAELLFFTNFGDTLRSALSGEGVLPVITLETPLIDFGVVEIGLEKDTLVQVIVRNRGSSAMQITPSAQLGPDTAQFSIVNPAPFVLQPNGVRPMTLQFKPQTIGRTSGRFGLEFNGIGSPAIVRLFGQGLGGVISLPEDSAFAGERREFPLTLSGVKPSATQGGTVPVRFRAEIEYDGTIVFCAEPAYFPVRSILSGKLTERLTIERPWDGTSAELARIPVIATLGTAEKTPLTITSFTWLSDAGAPLPVKSETRAGQFKLRGICETNDGKRFYRPEGVTALSAAYIVDNSLVVEFSAGETGRYTITAADMLGREMTKRTVELEKAGNFRHELALPNGSPNVVFVILRSPTSTEVMPLLSR